MSESKRWASLEERRTPIGSQGLMDMILDGTPAYCGVCGERLGVVRKLGVSICRCQSIRPHYRALFRMAGNKILIDPFFDDTNYPGNVQYPLEDWTVFDGPALIIP